MLRKSPIALAITLAFGLVALPAAAQLNAPAAAAAEPELAPITVTATRTERRVDDVPATVTITPASAIEQAGARDIKDVFRHEIDITVRAAPTRFTAAGASTGRAGNEGINIRGLEGNQVLLLVDGIRVPNAFSFGSFATGRGDFLNIDSAQAIEVLRGPASTQYGSDGLAGVVSLRTLAPADLLKPGQSLGGSARLGYNAVDHSWAAALAAAGRADDWQGLLLLSERRGHETGNQGSNDAQNSSRTTPNPVDYTAPSMLGKLLYTLSPAHQFGVTLDAQRRTQDTAVYSARALPPLSASSTVNLDTHDRLQRERVSFEHRYADTAGPWAQRAETSVYHQSAEVSQFAAEDRNTSADRTRDNRYTQTVSGLSTLLESNFGGRVPQRLSYGLELSRSEITGVRDGSVPPAGESFPTKPFPDTRYTLAGAFAQDEIEAGAFSVIPALRFDKYRLEPSTAGYSGGAAVALADQAVTPRLGLVWRLDPSFAPYAQWAHGFRAPTPDQVNNGFTNLASNYRSIGNPALAAEHAASIELGVRGQVGGLRWSLAGFDNRYKDFISQQIVGGTGTAADPTVYQYVNLANARVRGVELRALWQLDPAWSLNAGSGLTRGSTDSQGTRAPLDTIEPARTVLGLRYSAGAVAFDATALHAQGQSASRTNPIRTNTGTTPAYTPPSYTTLDLGAHWQVLPALMLNANLSNALDATYWRWSDVRGLADNSSVKDAYTAPGRSLQVSARYDF